MLLPQGLKDSLPYRLARGVYRISENQEYRRIRQNWRARHNRRLLRDYLSKNRAAMLQIGSGRNLRPGWLNSDYFPDDRAQYHLDASKPFDIPSGSFDLIYCEHMIEHLTLVDGLAMLRECERILKPGGRIRIVTPPLDFLLEMGTNSTEAHQRYIEWHVPKWMPSAPLVSFTVVINDFVRNWGHLFIYDEPTLRWAMERAGFVGIEGAAVNESREPRLRCLENVHRMPADLYALSSFILEAAKLAT